MGWDRGRYYTRSKKENGRVVREYIGGGRLGRLAAQRDAVKRADREAQARADREVKARLDALDEAVQAMIEVTDLAASVALLAAGYHQHKRGEWRKYRARVTANDRTGDSEANGRAAQVPQAGAGR